MKKLVLAATVAAVAVAAPVQAHMPTDPGSQGSEHSSGEGDGGGSHRCTPRKVAYIAAGAYVSGALTQTKGADTATDPSDDRYSGTVTVAVKRTNHHAKADKGTTKTYTLTDARVRFADRNGDGTPDAPVAGDRTRIFAKITKLRHRCDSTGFTPELTVKAVRFLAPAQD